MISMPLPTRNKVWGFYGAAAGFTDVDAAWSSALPALAKAARASAEGGGGGGGSTAGTVATSSSSGGWRRKPCPEAGRKYHDHLFRRPFQIAGMAEAV